MNPARRRYLPPFALLLLVGLALPGGGAVLGDEMPPAGKPAPAPAPGGADPNAPPEEDAIDDSEDGPDEFVARVNTAIEKGVEWLKKRQKDDGSYGPVVGNAAYGGGGKSNNQGQSVSGPTSLAMYALLKCKVPANDPVIKRGFAWLKKNHRLPADAYETSSLLLAVTATADPFKKRTASETAADREKIKLTGDMRAWALELQKHLLKKRNSGGGWRYSPGKNPAGGDQDLSSTQFACLALFAADRCGIKTDSKIWNDMITFAMAQQDDDGPSVDRAIEAREPKPNPVKKSQWMGEEPPAAPAGGEPAPAPSPGGGAKPKDRARGHAYIKSDSLDPDEGAATGGMTACGLGTIMMSRFILMHRAGEKLWENRDKNAVQQSVYDSSAWLLYNWNPIQNPKKARMNIYHLYYLYCVERAFDMIGNARLGPHFWYHQMGERLLSLQKPQGFWKTGTTHDPEDTLDTCFSLLFLKRATRGGIPFPSITGGWEEDPADNRGK